MDAGQQQVVVVRAGGGAADALKAEPLQLMPGQRRDNRLRCERAAACDVKQAQVGGVGC